MPNSPGPVAYRAVSLTLLLSALCFVRGTSAQQPRLPDSPPAEPIPRELTVLSQTLPPEEIDRAVLNRLLQDIALEPERSQQILGASEKELKDIYVAISNARNFINDSEMANIRAMCRAWRETAATGEQRIKDALAAYQARQQLTLNFIARYYRVVLGDIEATLTPATRNRFQAYMADRRRRMANAGTVRPGVVATNVQSGAEAVAFHCRG